MKTAIKLVDASVDALTLLALLEANLCLNIGHIALDLPLSRAVGLDEVKANEEQLTLGVLDQLDLRVLGLISLHKNLLIPSPSCIIKATTCSLSVPRALRMRGELHQK